MKMKMKRNRLTISLLTTLAVMLVPMIALAATGGDDGGFADAAAKGRLWMYLGAFGAGFATSLTPCVYPMIPIVVGVFGARDENVSRRKAFALSSMYVLGMGLLFASLGLVFTLIGKKSGFGSLLANPWVVIPMVMLYVVLAASMFGAFELALPQSLQNRLNKVGGRGYGGAFGLGMVGGLTAAPCTGPFLAGMIAGVAATGDPVLGFTLLFTYAMGLGMLFLLIGAFAVGVPKSGRWMEWVKSFGGVALLAAGFFFIRPLLPMAEIGEAIGAASSTFLILAIVVAIAGIALGAIHLSFHDRPAIKARKGIAVALTVAGITAAVTSIMTPDRFLPWTHDETAAFAQAKTQHKGVMIDFSANWCGPCKELELTFGNAVVHEHITENYVPLKFDVSDDTDHDDELKEKYNAANLPAVIFLDANGNEYARVTKYLKPGAFLDVLRPATTKIKNKAPLASSTPLPATKKTTTASNEGP